jgi:hypothetical protein
VRREQAAKHRGESKAPTISVLNGFKQPFSLRTSVNGKQMFNGLNG